METQGSSPREQELENTTTTNNRINDGTQSQGNKRTRSLRRSSRDRKQSLSSLSPARKKLHSSSQPAVTPPASGPTSPNESNKKSGRKTSSRSKKKKDEDSLVKEFDTSWICCECKEADCHMIPKEDADNGDDALIICEGPCRRLFHYPCAGLTRIPAESYVCKDCETNRFSCAICQTYGVADSDVFKCQESKCGLFFHEACLNMQDIPFRLEEEEQPPTMANAPDVQDGQNASETNSKSAENVASNELPAKIVPSYRRVFTCSAHACWCCSQEDMAKKHSKVLQEEKTSSQSTTNIKKKKKSKGGSVPKNSAAFESRKDGTLMRCLVCPRAYHVPCIPPSARFHELALLCHDHAYSFRLPELPSDSIQGGIEDAIDRKFDERAKRENMIARAKGLNTFFGGLKGNLLTANENELVQQLRDDDDDDKSDQNDEREAPSVLPFCLPCEIKDEVHSKPQAYRHVHSLKYDPNNRPNKIPQSGDICQCIDVCGEDCLNRMLYTECVGEIGARNSNCAVGKKCGNRRLAKRQFAKCKPMREKGRGWGLITCSKVTRGDLVTEYVGEVIDAKTKEKRLAEWAKEHPNDPNFYVMSLSQQWFIDAREVANLSRFINHSCAPNCSLTSVNVDGYLRNGIYALRDIEEGEFLSYDYRFDTRKENQEKFICRCGAPSCRGTMKDVQQQKGGEEAETKKLAWAKAKKNFDKDLAFLDQFEKQQVKSNVDSTVPAASNPDELVGNGPQLRYRTEVLSSRLFLWRVASGVGSDFERRLGKLEK